MANNSSNIPEIAASLAGSPEIADLVKREIRYNTVVSRLLAMRVQRGLSQEEVAERMECSASKVSRIESGNDFDLKWVDLVGYLEALNMKMIFSFEDPTLPASERIKHNVFRIHSGLEQLLSQARAKDGDENIAKKITQFYGEVLFNFLARYQESATKLQTVTGFAGLSAELMIPEARSEPDSAEPEPEPAL